MSKRNLAWHFLDGDKLRDGRTAPADGVWLEHEKRLVMCESGLHWSRTPFDALQYAPGETLCLDEVGGKIIEPKNDDKGLSSKRRIIVRMDAEPLLRYFARQQALSVLHLWEPPPAVLDYLMGDDAAMATARVAAWDAARDATRYAARAAAMEAAMDAAMDAARAAARYAARAAARAAAWAAARVAARDAAWAAARADFNTLVYESFEDWL